MTTPSPGPALVVMAAGRAKRYGGGLKPLARVGPEGATVIDLLASDAIGAGFATLVIVVSRESSPPIEAHVRRAWPSSLDVRFALQPDTLGTVDAVLAAYSQLDGAISFGVSNADDLYGLDAFSLLVRHLSQGSLVNALVAFRLDQAVIGPSPVTRGVCRVGPHGQLVQIDERRGVTRRSDGRFDTTDDGSPAVLEPAALVAMNLWGFRSSLEAEFRAAMASTSGREVLLPELVGQLVGRPEGAVRFEVLRTDSRCVGVTHPGDLDLVRADVAGQIARGERPARPWPDR